MTCKFATPYVHSGYTTNCIGDGVYQRNDGLITFDDARAKDAWQKQHSGVVGAAKTWAPWLIGGLVLGGGLYLLLRD